MTNKELTELMIKQLLHEWRCTKSTATAYDICSTLCEYYDISEGGQRPRASERGKEKHETTQ